MLTIDWILTSLEVVRMHVHVVAFLSFSFNLVYKKNSNHRTWRFDLRFDTDDTDDNEFPCQPNYAVCIAQYWASKTRSGEF